ncbi:thioredoxin family protein [Marinilabilia rubra]|uniref:Thioredoxin family protein n=1 Tax=Marinilabilia rubra TaxID=2162893 RepID=A0A2U2B6B4_9BACT|nr:thioredoxin family protein [Marinilabilia rubra]PWD98611.1 thioredoxin family protein [Marinilabilia rubra]
MKRAVVFLLALAFVNVVSAQDYSPGDKAMDFELKNIDDSMVSLSDYPDANGFIVIFTTNHCPYAKAYEDRIIELDKKFKSHGYPVIAINPNDPVAYPADSFEKMKVRAEEKGFTFPYLIDETQDVAKTYGATKTPHVFLLERENGALMVKYIGAIDDNYRDAKAVKKKYVEDAIASLKAGESVDVKETKAIGCSIKWKD